MKKNLIYVVAIACATLTFSSCKKEAKPAESETATEQVTEEAAPAINSVDQALNEYEKFIDETYIPALKGSMKGDVEAAKKFQEMLPKLEEIQKQFADATSFTPEQSQRLIAIGQKLTDAATQK